MTAQFYKFTHNHPIVLLQWVNFEICTIYLNKAIKKESLVRSTQITFTESSINDKRNGVVAAGNYGIKGGFLKVGKY